MDCLAWLRNIIVDMWKIIPDDDSGSGLQLHTQSSPGKRNGTFI